MSSDDNDRNFPVEDLEDLYENAPCGYLSLQPDGRISKANATLARWTGFSPDQLLTMRFYDLLTIGTRIFFETHYAPLLIVQGAFDEVSFDLKTAQGDTMPVFASAVERRDAAENLLFTRLTIFKAAERRSYERQLVEARKEADAARERSQALEAVTQELLRAERSTAELREQFIAVLGHDLRNPLASIEGGIGLLLKEPVSERSARLLSMIQGSVTRMSGLIENVLDFARGHLGAGIPLDLTQAVHLSPVLAQVLNELRVGNPGRAIEVDIDLPMAMRCDPSRIGQLVSNLLGNALTHGAPTTAVRVYARIEDHDLIISVANGGDPISPAALMRLFQPFFRGEIQTGPQGLGLGLHIASEIAKAHGGAISVASTEEETRFTFRMPIVGS